MTISVIIPFYNTPIQFFKELCSQIENLDKNSFEIIFVNDGSTNIDILEYVEKEISDKYVVIHNEHKGVSTARNSGIKAATKEYIMFIDSDDLFNYKLLNSFVLNYGVYDLYFFKGDTFFKTTEIKVFESTHTIKENKEPIEHLFSVSRNLPPNLNSFGFRSSWGILFNRKIIIDNCVGFDEELALSEDCVFNGDVFRVVNKTAFVYGPPLYHYRVNPISASKSLNYSFFDNYTRFYEKFVETNKDIEERIFFVNYDALAIYLNVRICMAIKHLNIRYAFMAAKMKPVKKAAIYFKDKKEKLPKYRVRICFYINHKLYFLVILSIIHHRVLSKLFS